MGLHAGRGNRRLLRRRHFLRCIHCDIRSHLQCVQVQVLRPCALWTTRQYWPRLLTCASESEGNEVNCEFSLSTGTDALEAFFPDGGFSLCNLTDLRTDLRTDLLETFFPDGGFPLSNPTSLLGAFFPDGGVPLSGRTEALEAFVLDGGVPLSNRTDALEAFVLDGGVPLSDAPELRKDLLGPGGVPPADPRTDLLGDVGRLSLSNRTDLRTDFLGTFPPGDGPLLSDGTNVLGDFCLDN